MSAHCFMPMVVEPISQLTRYSETGRWNVPCPCRGVEGETRGGKAAIRIPRGSKAAPCMLPTIPSPSRARVEQLPRNIIYIDAPHRARVSSFHFFHRSVMSRLGTAAAGPFPFPASSSDSLRDPVRFGPVWSARPCRTIGGYVAAGAEGVSFARPSRKTW